jgi:hypothetical protein
MRLAGALRRISWPVSSLKTSSACAAGRQSGGDQRHLIANGGDALVEPALFVGEQAGDRVHRHDAPADFVGDQNDVAGQVGQQFDQGRGFAANSGQSMASPASACAAWPAKSRLDSHSVRQSTSTQVSGAASSRSLAARCRVSSRSPNRPGGVRGGGRCAGHFAVAGFGGGQVDDAQAGFRRRVFRPAGSCPNGRRRGSVLSWPAL